MDEIKKAQRETLGKIEKMLAQVVGVQKMVHMEPGAFVKYAFAEITKAAEEDQKGEIQKSHVRLSLLYKSVLYSSANIESIDADNLKVPVFVCEQTSIDEQSNELYTPMESAKMNPAGGTVFEGGFIAKMMEQVSALATSIDKLGEDMEEGDDASKTEKKKPAFAGAAPPFGKEEEAPPSSESGKAKSKAKKDGGTWPDNMNDPNFIEKGERTPNDWGND